LLGKDQIGAMLPSLSLSLPAFVLLLLSVQGRDGGVNTRNLRLQVTNADGKGEERGILKLTEGSTLNLTCRVDKPDDGEEAVKLSWYLPNNQVQPGTKRYRLPQEGPSSTSTLVIDPVIETDTGDYECWAKQDWGEGTVKANLKVLIEPRRGTCQPGYYQCNGRKKICIATRYRCDRKQDCPEGDDESSMFCGFDPCKGKIVCPELDNRCIEPQEYCCDPATDPDCEFTYSCCEALLEFSLGTRLTAQYAKQQREGGGKGSASSSSYMLGYMVIGCAAAFLVIVVALGGAICRLHIQRKTRNAALVRGAGRTHPPITLHDLDIYFSERGEEDRADFQHIGITYNINHGVQILGPGGRGIENQPPPYSTQPRRVRDDLRRGPPPPYRSSEHLPEAPLLGEEEDGNNNGDINGNSDMTDNNAVLVVVNEPAEEAEQQQQRRRREDLDLVEGRRRAPPSPREAEPPPRYPGLGRRERQREDASSSDSDTE